MANAFHLSNSEIFAKHQASIAASLAHRLDVARANHNLQLVAQLEREQALLLNYSTTHPVRSWMSQVRTAIQQMVKAIAPISQLVVEQVADPSGSIWWYAFDPRSGKTLYAETESEVIRWIEDNRLGQ